MSGMKEAHIEQAMGRLGKKLDAYLSVSKESTERLNNLKSSLNPNGSRQEAIGIISKLSNPSQIAKEFAGDEIKGLNQQLAVINKDFSDAEELNKRANKMEQQAMDMRNETKNESAQINSDLETIKDKAKIKINTTPWVQLALDNEVAATNELRKRVNSLIEKEKNVSKLLEQVADIRREAIGKYKSVSRLGYSADENLKAIEQVAVAKQKNLDDSNVYKTDITQRMEALTQIDCEKFIPGGLESIRTQVNRFNNAFAKKDYATCSNMGQNVVDSLKEFYIKVSELKNAFEEAETNVKDHLKAARDEFATIDKAELKKWSGKANEVDKNYNELEKASVDIDEASKNGNKPSVFASPDSKISSAVNALRDLIELANQNKHKFQERDDIRKAIIKALKQQNYDKPVAYYNEKLPDGSPAELSDMTIYAQNPAGTGDMRLKIDLEGKIGLEVFRHDENGNEEEVTNQDAQSCHNSVNRLGEALKDFGFDFNVTNWGKAEKLVDTKSSAYSAFHQKQPEKQQERIRERVKETNRIRYSN